MERTKIEFAVQMSGPSCADKIRKSLEDVGELEIDLKEGRVIVTTISTPWSEVLERIERTGRKAVLSGFGGQSCVSIIDTGDALKGVVRWCAVDKERGGCVLDGVVDGLKPDGRYSIAVHECGDISRGCESTGDVFGDSQRLITADTEGRSKFRMVDENLKISDLIGRSVVVSDGVTNEKLGCGIIARSAGIFENYKKICACDGVTLWDERDRPLAGKGRRVEQANL